MEHLLELVQGDWGQPPSAGPSFGNTTGPDNDTDGPQNEVELSWISIGMATLLIFINITLSVRLSLGLESRLIIAAVRCVVQLSVLGIILKPIFNFGAGKDGRLEGESTWWLVVPYTSLMLCVAAVEASSKPASAYRWMLTHSLVAMGGSVLTVMTYVLVVVIRMKPWWNAQYFIPITGMLLGNATSGVSLGLSTLMNSITTQTRQVEMMLALGATRWEATKVFLHQAIITAMTPTLNTMSVVGIVSIPGMMTGQILGGQSPFQAARYQILIMFAILASSTLGCVSAVYMAASQLVDANHRYRPDRIKERTKSINGLIEWVFHKLVKFQGSLRMHWMRLSGRLLCCNPRSRGSQNRADAGWRGRWAGMDWQGWSQNRWPRGGMGFADQSLNDMREALSGELHQDEEDHEAPNLTNFYSVDSQSSEGTRLLHPTDLEALDWVGGDMAGLRRAHAAAASAAHTGLDTVSEVQQQDGGRRVPEQHRSSEPGEELRGLHSS